MATEFAQLVRTGPKAMACKLTDLIAPVSANEFFDQYWEKKCLYVRAKEREHRVSLFTLNDLDTLLSRLPSYSNVKLIGPSSDEKATLFTEAGTASLARVFKSFYDGCTVVVDGIHQFWEPVSRLCRDLTLDTGMACQANLYVTPRRSKGFECHWDGHDVLVVQSDGKKTWRLYEPGPLLPRPKSEGSAFTVSGGPTHEITLDAGDALYVPRGTPHEAEACDEPSVHVTVGLFATTWEDLLIAAVQSEGERDAFLRTSLPLGWSRDSGRIAPQMEHVRAAWRRLLREAHLKSAIDVLASQLVESAPSLPDGHFKAMDLADRIELGAVVEKRSGALLRISQIQNGVRLAFPGGFLAGPTKLFWAFQFMGSTGAFRVCDIPGWYSNEERLMLVKLLIRMGFLRIISSNPAEDNARPKRGRR
jgi:ribosomal protein L16 Arg81 hydroxylase